jgi:hypothetical protein
MIIISALGGMVLSYNWRMSDKRVIKIGNYNPYTVRAKLGDCWLRLPPKCIVAITMPNRTYSLCMYDSERRHLINAIIFVIGTRSAIIRGTKMSSFASQ